MINSWNVRDLSHLIGILCSLWPNTCLISTRTEHICWLQMDSIKDDSSFDLDLSQDDAHVQPSKCDRSISWTFTSNRIIVGCIDLLWFCVCSLNPLLHVHFSETPPDHARALVAIAIRGTQTTTRTCIIAAHTVCLPCSQNQRMRVIWQQCTVKAWLLVCRSWPIYFSLSFFEGAFE